MVMGFWRRLPCSSFPVHVQSHLDEFTPVQQLSRLERMNVEVDGYAKRFAYEAVNSSHPYLTSFSSTYGMPTVHFRGEIICTRLYHTLHKLCTRSSLISYWESRWGLKSNDSAKLAWSVFSRGMSALPWHRRIFVMKWLSRQTSLGSRKRSRVKQRSCPRCPSSHDDEAHCLRCMKVRPTLLLLLQSFYEDLDDMGTHPHIVEAIRVCTDLWLHPGRRQDPSILLQDIHFSVRQVFCEHYSFGWLQFLQGLHFSSLTTIQDSYFQYKNSKRSALKWHSKLVVGLWHILEKVYHHRLDALEKKGFSDDPDHEATVPALTAAKTELARGLRRIPVLHQHYFSHTPSTLEELDATSLQQWLKMVRICREQTHDTLAKDDCFSPGGKYRSWLLQ